MRILATFAIGCAAVAFMAGLSIPDKDWSYRFAAAVMYAGMAAIIGGILGLKWLLFYTVIKFLINFARGKSNNRYNLLRDTDETLTKHQ